MPHYYESPAGALAVTGDGPIAAASLPDDWTEITAEEYATKLEERQAAVDAAAAEWIANDGQVPDGGQATQSLPLADLRAQLSNS